MRILVIGGGAREHALCASFAADPAVSHVMAAPGNPGIGQLAEFYAVRLDEPEEMAALAQRVAADFVVIGPELPLVAGVADAVRRAGIACFGPSARPRRLEGSKSFAKEIMTAAGVPTAAARSLRFRCGGCAGLWRVRLSLCRQSGWFGGWQRRDCHRRSGRCARPRASCGRTIIEEYLDGPEMSLFVVTDGVDRRAVAASTRLQAHK